MIKVSGLWPTVIVVLASLAFCIWYTKDTRNGYDEVNASIEKINTELGKVSIKYAFVNPKPIPVVELHKSDLRKLYRMQIVAMEYEEMADKDTLTLEQKVDVLSMVMSNYVRFTFWGHETDEFNSYPTWDKWIKQIKIATDHGITKAIE